MSVTAYVLFVVRFNTKVKLQSTLLFHSLILLCRPGFKNFLISLVIFSAMAPIGIVAGSLLTSMNNSDFELEKVIAVTQARNPMTCSINVLTVFR